MYVSDQIYYCFKMIYVTNLFVAFRPTATRGRLSIILTLTPHITLGHFPSSIALITQLPQITSSPESYYTHYKHTLRS